jgi:hypothetical protein
MRNYIDLIPYILDLYPLPYILYPISFCPMFYHPHVPYTLCSLPYKFYALYPMPYNLLYDLYLATMPYNTNKITT